MERLNRLVRYWSPASPKFFRWSVDNLSGPKAFEALAFLIAVLVLSVVIRSESAALFFLMSFVTVLAVLVLTCRITEEYWLLKRSAIFLGVVMYFPLNFMASLVLACVPPFRFLAVEKVWWCRPFCFPLFLSIFLFCDVGFLFQFPC